MLSFSRRCRPFLICIDMVQYRHRRRMVFQISFLLVSFFSNPRIAFLLRRHATTQCATAKGTGVLKGNRAPVLRCSSAHNTNRQPIAFSFSEWSPLLHLSGLFIVAFSHSHISGGVHSVRHHHGMRSVWFLLQLRYRYSFPLPGFPASVQGASGCRAV